LQKIDTGTSAQWHTWLFINAPWASVSQRWVFIDKWTTWTWTGMIRIERKHASNITTFLNLNAPTPNTNEWFWINLLEQSWSPSSSIAWVTTAQTYKWLFIDTFSTYTTIWSSTATQNVALFQLWWRQSWTYALNVNWYIAKFRETLSDGWLLTDNAKWVQIYRTTEIKPALTIWVNVSSNASWDNVLSETNNLEISAQWEINFINTDLVTDTAPVWASKYINIKINWVAYRILAEAVA
jgi:hypothetical protein